MFRDREDAGYILAGKLLKYKGEDGIILAVAQGGIPVAYAVAKQLGMAADIMLTGKIVHPLNSAYPVGAASLDGYYVVPHELVTEEYVVNEVAKIRRRLRQLYDDCLDSCRPKDISGRTVIIIDDGMATGNTLMAIINLLRKNDPGKIIVAAPVASKAAVNRLNLQVQRVEAGLVPNHFDGVGSYYQHFEEVDDREIRHYLQKFYQLKQTV